MNTGFTSRTEWSTFSQRSNARLFGALASGCLAGVTAAGDPTAFVQTLLINDQPLKFDATYRITNAKAHGPGVTVAGNYVVLTTSTNWKFEATHDAVLLEAAGATGVTLKMKGEHLVAPHPVEAAPNFLPEIVSKSVDLAPGKLKNIKAWAGVDHPGDYDHIDTYGFSGEVRNRQVGAVTSISSSVYVIAHHGESSDSPLVSYRMCLNWNLFAILSYDAATRTLAIHAHTPQIVDAQGCATNGVDPAFGGDPLLAATLSITQLSVLDMNPDGSFPTSFARLRLPFDITETQLEGTIAPGAIAPNTPMVMKVRDGTIVVDTNTDDAPVSPVLMELARQNIFGDQDMTDPTGLIVRIETLSGEDLISTTNGFNQSVSLPVSVTLTSPAPLDIVECDSIDFNNDTSMFDPQDIDAFLSVYSEGPCIPETAICSDIDFNNDGSVFDPCDIDAFLLVFSEGPCTPCGA